MRLIPKRAPAPYRLQLISAPSQEQRVYTIKADRVEYEYVWYKFLAWARSFGNVDGLNILHCNMPLTPHMMQVGEARGGNSLGLAGTNDVLTSRLLVLPLPGSHRVISSSSVRYIFSKTKHKKTAPTKRESSSLSRHHPQHTQRHHYQLLPRHVRIAGRAFQIPRSLTSIHVRSSLFPRLAQPSHLFQTKCSKR